MKYDSALTFEFHNRHVCHFGISEGLAAIGGGDLIAALFGGGEAAAGAGAGAAGIGDLSSIVGTGEGLFGGATGLTGTLAAAGVPAADIASGAALGTAGLGAAGTAADFLAAPTALGGVSSVGGGFGAGADAAATSAATTGLSSVPTGAIDSLSGLSPGTGALGSAPAVSPASPTGGALSAPSSAPAAAGTSVAPAGAAPTDLTSITGTGQGLSGGSTGLQGTNLATGGSLTNPATGFTPDAPFNAPGSSIPGTTGPTAFGGATGPAPVTGASPASSGFSLDSLVNNAVKGITNNPLSLVGPAAGLGGLAYTISQANKQLPNETNLENAAATATQNGNQLSQYLLTGTLPPGLQTAVSKATQDAKTAAISQAAANGQSTDPSQNSTLAAELASIDQQSTITTATIGQQLLQSGMSETQLASTDYSTLVNADLTQEQLISGAIGNFAKSLGSLGTSGLKLNTGSSGVTLST